MSMAGPFPAQTDPTSAPFFKLKEGLEIDHVKSIWSTARSAMAVAQSPAHAEEWTGDDRNRPGGFAPRGDQVSGSSKLTVVGFSLLRCAPSP